MTTENLAIDPQVKKYLIDLNDLDSYLAHFPDYEEEMKKDLINPEYWSRKKVFITGISGFVGGHLAEKLIMLGSEVHGLVRRHSVPDYPNLANMMNTIKLYEGNLTDINSILSALKQAKPDVIFHLGAQSFVPTSFRVPIETYQTNVMGTTNLLEAVRNYGGAIDGIQIACSSEEYGMVHPDEVPITEENPLRPQSPYAVSKVATEMAARNHHKAYGLPVKITRTFNHEGPRRGLQFVTSVVARQIARARLRNLDTVTLGNAKAIRDFTDVRDIVQGYMLAIQHGKDGEPYNLGHGFGITIEDLVHLTAQVSGVKVRIETDPARMRPAEVPILLCNYDKAKKELGYRPRIPLTKAMSDHVKYFEEHHHLLDIERN